MIIIEEKKLRKADSYFMLSRLQTIASKRPDPRIPVTEHGEKVMS